MRLRSYRKLRFAIGLAVVGYAVSANGLKPAGRIEFFPFFNWSLFSLSSDRRSDTAILLRSIDGVSLPAPVLYYDMPNEFAAARAKDPSFAKLLDTWSFAVTHGDAATSERLRAVAEGTFMREARTARYDLVILFYNPLRRLREGKIDSVEIVGSFEKTTP